MPNARFWSVSKPESTNGITTEDSLAELGALAETAGAEVAGQVQQRLKSVDPRTFIGRGKTAEVRDLAHQRGATLAIFDDALSPAQARNLENELKLRVVDRSQLILDIFAQRARTLEGKLQVEVAQLSYLQPRLTRQWAHLSRQTGGGSGSGGRIGTRGPGETQLEVDRRRVRERLTPIAKTAEGSRAYALDSAPAPARRSLSDGRAGRLHEFRQIDPDERADRRRRRGRRPSLFDARSDDSPTQAAGTPHVMLADTVGFIHRLPHMLVEAFKATLEEVRTADLLLHVVDASSPLAGDHIEVVDRVLEEIGAGDKPRIIVLNKADLLANPFRRCIRSRPLRFPRFGARDSIGCST